MSAHFPEIIARPISVTSTVSPVVDALHPVYGETRYVECRLRRIRRRADPKRDGKGVIAGIRRVMAGRACTHDHRLLQRIIQPCNPGDGNWQSIEERLHLVQPIACKGEFESLPRFIKCERL